MSISVSSDECIVALIPRVLRALSGDPHETTFSGYVFQDCVLQCFRSFDNLPIVTQIIVQKTTQHDDRPTCGHETAIRLIGSTAGSRENLTWNCSTGRSNGGGP